MKAILWTRYGPPESLQLGEIEKPEPKDHEILVNVRAATVTAGDIEVRSMKIQPLYRPLMRLYVGWRRPVRMRVLGQELAGVVEAVGKGVRGFLPGDAVVGLPGASFGAYAEYVCIPDRDGAAVLAHKPANLSFEEAACLPFGGLEAMHMLQLGKLQAGETILVNGAGGSIGTAVVQLARHYGAEVTAVDLEEKHAMLRDLGAAHVFDHTKVDFTRRGEAYDVVFDVIGKASAYRVMRTLNPGGRLLAANPQISHYLMRMFAGRREGKRVITWSSHSSVENLQALVRLAESGQFRPVVDRVFEMDQAVEAHRYGESGRKKGNVVIRIG